MNSDGFSAPDKKYKSILYVFNVTWFFLSHRRPVAQAAVRAGYRVHVAAALSAGDADKIVADGMEYHQLPIARRGMNPFNELKTFWALLKLYKTLSPDLVELATIKPVLYGCLAARLHCGVKVVNWMTGLGYVFIAGRFVDNLLRLVVINFYRFAFQVRQLRIIFENPDDNKYFIDKQIVPADKTILIPGAGVNTKHYVPIPERVGSVIVILPARMLWDKGIQEFVDAAKLIKACGVDARFALVGAIDPDNPASITENQLCQWQTENVVEWWGHQTDMPAIYAKSHIVCLPSYREGLPKSLLEAAACGRPIVATDVPGCREIVRHGENGFLVSAKSSKKLAGALYKLIMNPELRRKMGVCGREIVEQKFSENKIIEETLSLYREMFEK